MLQFRINRVKFISDRENHEISIVCPDGTRYVSWFDGADDESYFNLECVLLWLAEYHSDVTNEDDKVLNIIRDLEFTAERHNITCVSK